MARSTRHSALGFVLLLVACGGCSDARELHPSAAQAHPETKREPAATATATGDDARRWGAAAGIVSPRLADCGAHCAKQLGELTQPLDEQGRAIFAQSCREACEQQMTGATPSASKRAHDAAAAWRELYLQKALLDQRVFCIGKLTDKSAEAAALLKASEAATKTPEARAADQLERAAGELAAQLARTEEGSRVLAAREELERVNKSDGPRSANANAARRAVTDADAAADATPLGQRVEEAVDRAQDARAKANRSPAMAEAYRKLEEHSQALAARMATLSREEQMRRSLAMTECIKAWSDQQMRRALRESKR